MYSLEELMEMLLKQRVLIIGLALGLVLTFTGLIVQFMYFKACVQDLTIIKEYNISIETDEQEFQDCLLENDNDMLLCSRKSDPCFENPTDSCYEQHGRGY